VAAALFDLSPVAYAVTVTVAGAGNGLSYNPVLSIDPALPVQPTGPATPHVTAELYAPVPLTVPVNCAVDPIVTVAVDGLIATPVIVGPAGGPVTTSDPPPPHPATKAKTAEPASPAQPNKCVRIVPLSPPAIQILRAKLRSKF
jgi:hypothetical protein